MDGLLTPASPGVLEYAAGKNCRLRHQNCSMAKYLRFIRSHMPSRPSTSNRRSGCLITVFALFFIVTCVSGASGNETKGIDYYYKIGDWQKVVASYNAELREIKQQNLLNMTAEAYYGLGKLSQTKELAEKALAIQDNLDSRILLILVKAGKGDSEGAMKDLESLKNEHPDDHRVYTAMGMTVAHDDEKKAIAFFEKATKMNPDDFKAWFNLGLIYEEAESFEKATKAYKNAVRINPMFAMAQNNLGYSYKERHFYAYAVEHYRKAIELRPDIPGFYYNIGNAYTHEEKIDAAFEAYKKAIELDPKFAKAHYNMARTYLRKDRVRDAIEEFKLYVEYGTPEVFDYVSPKARVEDEIRQLEEYLTNNPDYRPASGESSR